MIPKIGAIVVVTVDFFFQIFVVVLVAADGIYPKWSTIVQTIRDPHFQKKKYFTMTQESFQKNV
uniref:Uncharacterized protein n=1 Tax=Solanum lycopersicum TaxID=4081 RepID=K4CK27_SOLLC